MIHDLSFERFPEHYPSLFRRWIRWATRLSTRRATLLLALSESTRQDLIDLYGVDGNRVEVAYPGIAVPDGPSRDREPVILYVGDFSPRKRVPLLIEAYRRYRGAAGTERVCELELIGGGGPDEARVSALAAATEGVRLLGRVDDGTLDDRYRRATLLVYPSLYEGFGLPIVEALGRGTPVLAARNSSLPEAGGEAAHYTDAETADELAEDLLRLLTDRAALLEDEDSRRAQARAFDPTTAADRVAELITRAIGTRR